MKGGKNMSSERFSRTAPVLEIGSLKAGRLKLAMEILTENVDLDANRHKRFRLDYSKWL